MAGSGGFLGALIYYLGRPESETSESSSVIECEIE